MDLRVLQYFLTIAREENITKAAQSLHVTQPTLSRQLMQLEAELGVKLFTRSNHSIILTDEGMLFKRRAQELVSLAEKARRELQATDRIAGEIAIGSGEYQSSRLLATMLAAFQQRYPDIIYGLYSGNSDNIKERIEQGILDVGLLLEPVDIGKYEFTRLPATEEWGVLVRADSDLAGQAVVTPADLAHRPLIFTPRDLVQQEMTGWFGVPAAELHIVASGNLLYNMAAMVRSGIGVALTLKLDCQYEGLRYVPLSPKLETHTVLAWKKDQSKSKAIDAFLDFAKKYVYCMASDKK